MWLVLCHADDLAALWLYDALRMRCTALLELVTAEGLACNFSWEHRLGKRHQSIAMKLADGRSIRSDDIQGAVNRIRFAPFPMWNVTEESDREYIHQELNAFYLSWLYALPGKVFNRPTANGMCGAWRPDAVWTQLAGRAGLCCALPRHDLPFWSQHNTVIVVDGIATNTAAPKEVAAGCCRLSEIAETSLLGINFEIDDTGAWLFRTATPVPDLRLGGSQLV